MRISSVGKTTEAGVTLIEMMIVATLIALVAGISYPAVASGLETLRLRSASDSIVGFLNTALDRADRRQQAVQIQIWAREGILVARSADLGFVRRLEIAEPLHITDILPHVPVPQNPGDARNIIVYPGGAVPRIGIELSTPQGRKRLVGIDPITGVPRAQ
jgi:prepilin-type N-terminal cleavage/methylation domain-containing protein